MASLDQLKYAVALERLKHFGKAAKECHVSQPALSTQIKNLEEELGITLFSRAINAVEATEEGRPLLTQAKRILREHEALLDLASQNRKQTYFEIKLGILPTIAPYLVPELMRALQKPSPIQLKLSIFELTTEECLHRLNEEHLDGALLATDIEGVPKEDIKILDEPFVVYFHKDHPALKNKFISKKDLHPEESWLLGEGHCLREQSLDLCSSSKRTSRSISFESGSLETLIHVVDRSGGFTIVPASCLTSFGIKKSQLRRFKFPEPTRTLGILKSRPSLKSQGFIHLSEKLREAFSHLLKDSVSVSQ